MGERLKSNFKFDGLNMNRIVAILMAACLSLSCVMDDYGVTDEYVENAADETYTFFIEHQKPELLSRSSFSRYESESIRNINIFVRNIFLTNIFKK